MGQRINQYWLLGGIILVGMGLRLIGFTNPLLDDQGWRQADTASMALNMLGKLTDFPDVFYPKLNYDGWEPQHVELEFPFLPYILALTWSAVGQSDAWGRLWALIFSVTTIIGIYEFGKQAFSHRVGIYAAAIYSVTPMAVYYGRVVMPETISQTLSIWALVAALQLRSNPSAKRIVTAALLLAVAVLAKLPQLMIFPVAICVGFWPFKAKLKAMVVYSLLALSLPTLYYVWVHMGTADAQQYVSGIFSKQVVAEATLFPEAMRRNFDEGIGLPLMLMTGIGVCAAGWSGLRAFRMSKLMSSVEVSAEGTSIRQRSGLVALVLWSLISALYVGLICQRIPLDYYLVPVLLPIALSAALALSLLEDIPAGVVVILLISLLLLKYSEAYPQKYLWNDQYLIQANWLKQHTPKSAKLILSDSPPMTLYYAERYGKRLIETNEEDAFKQLQRLDGEYLVALPGSRSEGFWLKMRALYPEVGPGVYRLTK